MSKTPKLRFKEFSGDWESCKLSKITLLVKDGTHGTHADVECGPYLLSAKNIKDGKIIISNNDRKISYQDYNSIYKNYSLKKDDILLSIVGTIGNVAIMSDIKDIAFQRSVAILRFNLDASYAYQYINTNIFQNQLLKKQVLSAQPGIYLNDLKKLDMSVPSKEEQEKIASFLSLVDDKIFLQSEKVNALKDYKKGIMQKIFNRELRFKDDEGRDYPEWEEKKLGDIGSVVTGNTPSTKDKDNYGKEYLWASPADLGNHKVINNTINKLSEKGFKNVRKIPKGSILATCIGSTIGKIGMAYYEMSTNQQINTLICNDNINNDFIYYSLEYNFPRYLSYVTYQAVPIINKTQFQEFDIKLPILEEQIKIGKILSQIEIKIEKEKEKLDLLNIYKKGLLQQMFV